jgi:L,D-peptidoglycan transpeptidase YkuD (ErfK/YbiS/YcfS/YnhG family)
VAGVPQLAQAGSANQAIVVTATGYQVNDATLTAYTRMAGGWVATFGPWPARIGYAGFAPPGQKMEGDGRTPSGAYGFDFMFGVSADPGVKFAYRHITTQTIVWDDDPKSALYNEWVDTKTQDAGTDPEDMYQPLAYQYGAVIAYNSARTPGLGSAIFLHATIGGPTAGCVSIATDQLVQVLEWLDPAQSPRIIMGVA